MQKKHKIFLQCVMDKQNHHEDLFYNRPFLLKDRLIKKHGFSEKKVEKTRADLERANLIAKSSNGILSITDKGKDRLWHEHQSGVMTCAEKITQNFNKKLSTPVAYVTLIISILQKIHDW